MKSVYAALPSKTYLEVEIKVLLIIKTKILLETTHNTELSETTVTSASSSQSWRERDRVEPSRN